MVVPCKYDATPSAGRLRGNRAAEGFTHLPLLKGNGRDVCTGTSYGIFLLLDRT